jgi:(R)-2-hydroxyacyl-CoA dehydratese activating ATPase
MRAIGIDIGSRTIKVAVLENGYLALSRKADSSYVPLGIARRLLEGLDGELIVATGYGRHNFKAHFACEVISEIKAFARGARFVFPHAQAVLDIGGQDTKVIGLNHSGGVAKFEMNDRCAAGTGRFLEIMANALHFNMDEFGAAACRADRAASISSMCTVFAESEVVSLMTSGADRGEIALGIHEAILQRASTMLGRLPPFGNLVFAGGVAYNRCMTQLLAKKLKVELLIPPDPQIIGALGAAIEGNRVLIASGLEAKVPVETN